jgi:hypothetical protein
VLYCCCIGTYHPVSLKTGQFEKNSLDFSSEFDVESKCDETAGGQHDAVHGLSVGFVLRLVGGRGNSVGL